MKKAIYVFTILIFFFGIAMPLTAHATSYVPFVEEHRQLKEKASMKAGSVLYLFHSGINNLVTTVPVGDTIAVYRRDMSYELIPVGKIKILSYAGENTIKGIVVEGEIMPDDIAVKGKTALLVIFPDAGCNN